MTKTPIEQLMRAYDQIGVSYERFGESVVVMTTDGVNVAIPKGYATLTMVHIEVDPDAVTAIDVSTMVPPKVGGTA